MSTNPVNSKVETSWRERVAASGVEVQRIGEGYRLPQQFIAIIQIPNLDIKRYRYEPPECELLSINNYQEERKKCEHLTKRIKSTLVELDHLKGRQVQKLHKRQIVVGMIAVVSLILSLAAVSNTGSLSQVAEKHEIFRQQIMNDKQHFINLTEINALQNQQTKSINNRVRQLQIGYSALASQIKNDNETLSKITYTISMIEILNELEIEYSRVKTAYLQHESNLDQLRNGFLPKSAFSHEQLIALLKGVNERMLSRKLGYKLAFSWTDLNFYFNRRIVRLVESEQEVYAILEIPLIERKDELETHSAKIFELGFTPFFIRDKEEKQQAVVLAERTMIIAEFNSSIEQVYLDDWHCDGNIPFKKCWTIGEGNAARGCLKTLVNEENEQVSKDCGLIPVKVEDYRPTRIRPGTWALQKGFYERYTEVCLDKDEEATTTDMELPEYVTLIVTPKANCSIHLKDGRVLKHSFLINEDNSNIQFVQNNIILDSNKMLVEKITIEDLEKAVIRTSHQQKIDPALENDIEYIRKTSKNILREIEEISRVMATLQPLEIDWSDLNRPQYALISHFELLLSARRTISTSNQPDPIINVTDKIIENLKLFYHNADQNQKKAQLPTLVNYDQQCNENIKQVQSIKEQMVSRWQAIEKASKEEIISQNKTISMLEKHHPTEEQLTNIRKEIRQLKEQTNQSVVSSTYKMQELIEKLSQRIDENEASQMQIDVPALTNSSSSLVANLSMLEIWKEEDDKFRIRGRIIDEGLKDLRAKVTNEFDALKFSYPAEVWSNLQSSILGLGNMAIAYVFTCILWLIVLILFLLKRENRLPLILTYEVITNLPGARANTLNFTNPITVVGEVVWKQTLSRWISSFFHLIEYLLEATILIIIILALLYAIKRLIKAKQLVVVYTCAYPPGDARWYLKLSMIEHTTGYTTDFSTAIEIYQPILNVPDVIRRLEPTSDIIIGYISNKRLFMQAPLRLRGWAEHDVLLYDQAPEKSVSLKNLVWLDDYIPDRWINKNSNFTAHLQVVQTPRTRWRH